MILLLSLHKVVLVEVFAEEGCIYCPTALAAAEWLDTAYADTVAVVQYIYPDLANGAWRLGYYGVSGYPTAWIDGVFEEVGGSLGDTLSVFNRYKTWVDYRVPIDPVLSIFVDSSGVEGDSGFVAARVRLEAGMAYQSPKVFAMLTHSHQWNDGRWNRFKFMGIVSGQYGDSLPIRDQGEEAPYFWKFYVKSEWNPDSMQVVVFVQDSATKEVLQAVQVPLGYVGVREEPSPNFGAIVSGEILKIRMPSAGRVSVRAYSPAGRLEERLEALLGPGLHRVRLRLGAGVHLVLVESPFGKVALKTLRR